VRQVSTPELNEVMTINAMAPFIINARLRPLMERRPEVCAAPAAFSGRARDRVQV